jgi:hypothetical protein
MLDLEEAVARFLSSGNAYDRKVAKQLIAWLDRCGYIIVRKVDRGGGQPTHAVRSQQVTSADECAPNPNPSLWQFVSVMHSGCSQGAGRPLLGSKWRANNSSPGKFTSQIMQIWSGVRVASAHFKRRCRTR